MGLCATDAALSSEVGFITLAFQRNKSWVVFDELLLLGFQLFKAQLSDNQILGIVVLHQHDVYKPATRALEDVSGFALHDSRDFQ